MADPAQHETVFDVGRQHIAAVYAKALLEASEGTGTSEALVEELKSLAGDVLDRLPKLDAVLQSPQVSAEEKGRLLEKAFSGRMSPQLLTFLRVLAKRNRLDCLRAIARQFESQLRETRGRVRVIVTTAAPVDAAVGGRLSMLSLGQVKDQLTGSIGRPVEIEHRIDAAVIGGIVVRIGDRVFDGSVRRQLEQLGRQAVEKAVRDLRGSLDRFVAG